MKRETDLFTLRIHKANYSKFTEFVQRHGLSRNGAVNMAIANLLEEDTKSETKKAPA